jgi:hypothetical protein
MYNTKLANTVNVLRETTVRDGPDAHLRREIRRALVANETPASFVGAVCVADADLKVKLDGLLRDVYEWFSSPGIESPDQQVIRRWAPLHDFIHEIVKIRTNWVVFVFARSCDTQMASVPGKLKHWRLTSLDPIEAPPMKVWPVTFEQTDLLPFQQAGVERMMELENVPFVSIPCYTQVLMGGTHRVKVTNLRSLRRENAGGVLCDEPGMGKRVQVFDLINRTLAEADIFSTSVSQFRQVPTRTTLIVTNANNLDKWISVSRKHHPSIRPVVIANDAMSGTPDAPWAFATKTSHLSLRTFDWFRVVYDATADDLQLPPPYGCVEMLSQICAQRRWIVASPKYTFFAQLLGITCSASKTNTHYRDASALIGKFACIHRTREDHFFSRTLTVHSWDTTVAIDPLLAKARHIVAVSCAQAIKYIKSPRVTKASIYDQYIQTLNLMEIDARLLPLSYFVTFNVPYVTSVADTVRSRASAQTTVAERMDGMCAICMGDYESPVYTQCLHVFCKECMDASLKSSNTCPLCRTPITTTTDVISTHDSLISALSSDEIDIIQQLPLQKGPLAGTRIHECITRIGNILQCEPTATVVIVASSPVITWCATVMAAHNINATIARRATPCLVGGITLCNINQATTFLNLPTVSHLFFVETGKAPEQRLDIIQRMCTIGQTGEAHVYEMHNFGTNYTELRCAILGMRKQFAIENMQTFLNAQR